MSETYTEYYWLPFCSLKGINLDNNSHLQHWRSADIVSQHKILACIRRQQKYQETRGGKGNKLLRGPSLLREEFWQENGRSTIQCLSSEVTSAEYAHLGSSHPKYFFQFISKIILYATSPNTRNRHSIRDQLHSVFSRITGVRAMSEWKSAFVLKTTCHKTYIKEKAEGFPSHMKKRKANGC